MTEVFSFLSGVGVLGAVGAFFMWGRSRFTVNKRELLVVKRDGRFEQQIHAMFTGELCQGLAMHGNQCLVGGNDVFPVCQ